MLQNVPATLQPMYMSAMETCPTFDASSCAAATTAAMGCLVVNHFVMGSGLTAAYDTDDCQMLFEASHGLCKNQDINVALTSVVNNFPAYPADALTTAFNTFAGVVASMDQGTGSNGGNTQGTGSNGGNTQGTGSNTGMPGTGSNGGNTQGNPSCGEPLPNFYLYNNNGMQMVVTTMCFAPSGTTAGSMNTTPGMPTTCANELVFVNAVGTSYFQVTTDLSGAAGFVASPEQSCGMVDRRRLGLGRLH